MGSRETLREALANLPPPDLGVPPSSDRTWLAGMQYGATVAWRATRADAAALAEPESDTLGGLDVPTLARAISRYHRRSYIDMLDRLAADKIAAEYARLRSSTATETPGEAE